MPTAENCCKCGEVATAFSGRIGRDADEDRGALKVALGSMEDNAEEKEEEDVVIADMVDIIVDEGKVKVDEVEKTGDDRREESPAFG